MFGYKRFETKKIFYDVINNFFDEIEKELNIKVMVLPHPKSKTTKNFNYYKTRKIIRNKKMQAFRNCKFVMHRGSTAFSYAVLFNKPSVILTSQEIIDRADVDTINYLKFFSEESGNKIININYRVEKKTFLKNLLINKAKYRKFRNKLVFFENKMNSSLIANYIKEIM